MEEDVDEPVGQPFPGLANGQVPIEVQSVQQKKKKRKRKNNKFAKTNKRRNQHDYRKYPAKTPEEFDDPGIQEFDVEPPADIPAPDDEPPAIIDEDLLDGAFHLPENSKIFILTFQFEEIVLSF